MTDREQGVLGQASVQGEDVREAMGQAIADALREHKDAGRSVVTWDRENDRVAIVPAEEIAIPEEALLAGSHPAERNGSA